MSKGVTGRYECEHGWGGGLEYFTLRVERLELGADGRFRLSKQERSRLSQAAHALMSGQEVTLRVPEVKREGAYRLAGGNSIVLHFEDGACERGEFVWNGEGLQLGEDVFTKVSEASHLPPRQGLQKELEDMGRGIQLARALGGIARKAAKTMQGTFERAQERGSPPTQGGPSQEEPSPCSEPAAAAEPGHPALSAGLAQGTSPGAPAALGKEARFCDQCGGRRRAGKKFCQSCGARVS